MIVGKVPFSISVVSGIVAISDAVIKIKLTYLDALSALVRPVSAIDKPNIFNN